MILDEVTSALNVDTEREIPLELIELRGRTTIVFVTHKIETVNSADQILWPREWFANSVFRILNKLTQEKNMSVDAVLSRLRLRDPRKTPIKSYSQNGEDLVLLRLLEGKRQGFYVDVGAHHPFRFSNTCLLHNMGWRGINLDAEPGSMAQFRKYRPGDVNIECGVGDSGGKLNYFRFNESALNTFDRTEAERKNIAPYKLIEVLELEVKPLSEILEMYVSPDQSLDVLTVDAEGHDLQVLRSNDWVRFSPQFVLAETLSTTLMDIETNELTVFMKGVGYSPINKVYDTVFFKKT